MVQATVGVFGALAGLGLAGTATRYVAEQRTSGPQAGKTLGLLLKAGLISSSVALLFAEILAPWIAREILSAPQLTDPLRATAPLLVVGALTSTMTGALGGLEAFRVIAGIGFVSAASSAAISLGLVALAGFRGALAALVVNGFVTFALTGRALAAEGRKNRLKLSFRGETRDLSMIWHYAMPSFLAGALVAPASWAARSALASHPRGYEELGLFTAANQWGTVVSFGPAVLAGVMLPLLVGTRSEEGREPFRRLFWTNVLLVSVIAVTTATLLAIASPLLIGIYGTAFGAAGPVLLALLAAATFDSVNHAVGLALSTTNRMWWALAINALWAAELYGLALAFRNYGALGLGYAWMCAYALQTLQLVIYAAVTLRRREQ